MRSTYFCLCFLLLLISSSIAGPKDDPEITRLKAISQELLDAVAPGNKAVWEKYLSEDCLYVDEEGNVSTKADLLEEFSPLPPGYKGQIVIGDHQARVFGNTAILTHRDHESLELFGQKLLTQFQTTTTFLRTNEEWKVVFIHVTVLPSELTPVAVNPEIYSRYTGRYELAPDVFYTVTKEGSKLFAQRNGREKEELFPISETTFFRKGHRRGVRIFESDDQGKVIRMIDRRDNNDLIWTKKQGD